MRVNEFNGLTLPEPVELGSTQWPDGSVAFTHAYAVNGAAFPSQRIHPGQVRMYETDSPIRVGNSRFDNALDYLHGEAEHRQVMCGGTVLYSLPAENGGVDVYVILKNVGKARRGICPVPRTFGDVAFECRVPYSAHFFQNSRGGGQDVAYEAYPGSMPNHRNPVALLFQEPELRKRGDHASSEAAKRAVELAKFLPDDFKIDRYQLLENMWRGL
jgi:hypothetical protein